MQKKGLNKFIFAGALVSLLSFYEVSASVAAYIPNTLRECFIGIHEITAKRSGGNFQELYTIIMENRVLASSALVRSAVYEALDALEGNANWEDKWRCAASAYLQEYLNSLDNRSILCRLQGSDAVLTTLPNALIARSLKTDSTSMDMIRLSSELTFVHNIELCGDTDINLTVPTRAKSIKPTKLTSPSLIFNPNMLTSVVSSSPNVVFGTGASDPVINAWSMSPSTSIQSPINMQFSIPGDLKTEKAISIEMHFLVKKQSLADGNARIQINALYVNNNTEFSMPDSITFTHTTDSNDFAIVEPSNVDGLMHVFINVDIEKSVVEKRDFALISLTRILPDGTEYAGDIYLVAAAFKYTPTN